MPTVSVGSPCVKSVPRSRSRRTIESVSFLVHNSAFNSKRSAEFFAACRLREGNAVVIEYTPLALAELESQGKTPEYIHRAEMRKHEATSSR